jgi:hypothetical protein
MRKSSPQVSPERDGDWAESADGGDRARPLHDWVREEGTIDAPPSTEIAGHRSHLTPTVTRGLK